MSFYYWLLPLGFLVVADGMPTETSIPAMLVGQIVIFLTTLIGIWVSVYRENRARRWAKEDAEALAAKVESEAQKVKEETERVMRHVGNNVSNIVVLKAREASTARAEIGAQLELNTELTKLAVNGPGKHLYENADGTPKILKVEVTNDREHRVPTEEVAHPNKS